MDTHTVIISTIAELTFLDSGNMVNEINNSEKSIILAQIAKRYRRD